MQKKFLALLIYAATFVLAVSGQTGGPYDLSHNVIASGGGTSSGGVFRLDGTVGQGIAGASSSGGQFSVHGGFWIPASLAPTAADVSISGRTLSAYGVGIRGVTVTLTAPNGGTHSTITNTYGYFRFTNVEAGATYVVLVSSRRHSFENPTRILTVQDNVTNFDFVAQ